MRPVKEAEKKPSRSTAPPSITWKFSKVSLSLIQLTKTVTRCHYLFMAFNRENPLNNTAGAKGEQNWAVLSLLALCLLGSVCSDSSHNGPAELLICFALSAIANSICLMPNYYANSHDKACSTVAVLHLLGEVRVEKCRDTDLSAWTTDVGGQRYSFQWAT